MNGFRKIDSTPASGISKEQRIHDAVQASRQRILQSTQHWEVGMHSALLLTPRRQKDPKTCFFAGPIQVAEQFHHQPVLEQELATAARAQGFLDDNGAITYTRFKEMERFVEDQTTVRIWHNEPTGFEHVDQRLLACIEDGNLAMLFYPKPLHDKQGRYLGIGEWVTVYGVEVTSDDVIFYMTFSGSDEHEILNASEMAKRMYGVYGGNSAVWALEVQTKYPKQVQFSDNFAPRSTP